MKKLLSVMLAVCLMLSLSACADNTKNEAPIQVFEIQTEESDTESRNENEADKNMTTDYPEFDFGFRQRKQKTPFTTRFLTAIG